MTDIIDAKTRNTALEPGDSFIVQAPAGSGKTELLTQRFLKLLSFVDNPEEIRAVTFTRKAAAQMQSRLLSTLTALHSSDHSSLRPETRALAQLALAQNERQGWDLLANPHRLRIQTIDSLCANLAQTAPLSQPLGCQNKVSDFAERYYQEASQQLLLDLEEQDDWNDALKTCLMMLDNDFLRLERLLTELLAKRDQWLELLITARTQSNLRPQLEKNWQRVILDLQQGCIRAFPQELLVPLQAMLDFAKGNDSFALDSLLQNPALSTQEHWLELAQFLLTQTGQLRRQVDSKLGFPAPSGSKDKTEQAEFKAMKETMMALLEKFSEEQSFIEALGKIVLAPAASYDEEQWSFLESLLTLLPLATAHLQIIFKQNNAIDFVEVTQMALNALGTPEAPSDFNLKLDYQIKHLLVDEFQDTSLIQFQLLERLTAGWINGDGRSLFLVGDPMQSIYRFRNADVSLFLQAKQFGVGSLSLTPLTLQMNFRTQTNLVEKFNTIFSDLFPKQADITTAAIPYSPATACNPASEKTPIELVSSKSALIDTIKSIKGREPEATIAILVKARSHLEDLATRLESENLAYTATDMIAFHQEPTVIDLVNLTQALTDCTNRIAWLAMLRAPWCGLTLADLLQVSYPLDATIVENLSNPETLASLSENGQARLHKIGPLLLNAYQSRYRQAFNTEMRTLWLQLSGPSCQPTAKDCLLAEDYFSLLGKVLLSDPLLDLEAFKYLLKKHTPNQKLTSNQSIQIMTIHKSKGLEFDYVILPGLEKGAQSDRKTLLKWMDYTDCDGKSQLLLAPLHASDNQAEPLYRFIDNQDKQKAKQEQIRLLYVAATRAKHQLILCAEDKAAPSSFLKMLEPAFTRTPNNTPLAEAQPPAPSKLIRRLKSDFLLNKVHTVEPPATNPLLQFEWQPNYHAMLGTQAHKTLEWLAAVENEWTPHSEKNWVEHWRRQLRPSAQTEQALEDSICCLKTVITNVLTCPRGQWILSNHKDACSELPLLISQKAYFQTIILDRTFIDETQRRWIIDYKIKQQDTVSLEEEKRNYCEQLDAYAKAMTQLHDEPISLGLYFPLQKAWIAWEYDTDGQHT